MNSTNGGVLSGLPLPSLRIYNIKHLTYVIKRINAFEICRWVCMEKIKLADRNTWKCFGKSWRTSTKDS